MAFIELVDAKRQRLSPAPHTVFDPLDEAAFARASCVCLGTGRFLRAVLVPALREIGIEIVLAQARGTSFGTYMQARGTSFDTHMQAPTCTHDADNSHVQARSCTYEVDTVLADGTVLSSEHAVAACGSLGVAEGRTAFLRLPARLQNLRYIGVGLTEAGIVHNGPAIADLAEFLHACFDARRGSPGAPLSVLNTDNLPFNGDVIRRHVCSCDFVRASPRADDFLRWLEKHVAFHNSMVDRITAHRHGCADVPRAEPLPQKALVIEDVAQVLPPALGSVPGVVVRTAAGTLAHDLQLKLRVANGTHTAMVYAMALGRRYNTDQCTLEGSPILPYLERLFECDIVHLASEFGLPRAAVIPTFREWIGRLSHPHFGLDCFFVCQNATAKLAIRLIPSVAATLLAGEVPSDFMAFAIAALLRFLTPMGDHQPRLGEQPQPVFVGRLDAPDDDDTAGSATGEAYPVRATAAWEYVNGLRVDPNAGTYEFKDDDGIVPSLLRPLGGCEGSCSTATVAAITTDVLSRVSGIDPRANSQHRALAHRVAALLQRMLNGEGALKVLRSLNPTQPPRVRE